MKKLKNIMIAVVAVLVVGAGLFIGLRYYQVQKQAEEPATKTSTEIIEQRFETAAKLETAKCISTCVDRYEDEVNMKKDWNIPINFNVPFTKKSLIVSYVGTVSAGIEDLTQAKIAETEDSIKVTLPKIKVFDVTIKNDSLEVIEEKSKGSNKLSIEEFNDSQIRIKEKIKQQAIDNQLVEMAQTNAETLIKGLLGDFEKTITIEWEE